MADETGGSDRSEATTLDVASAGGREEVAAASRTRSPGHESIVIAAIAATVPATLLAAAAAFDVQSQRAADQYVFATGGFYLAVAGVLAGVAATIVIASRLGKVERDTTAFRQGRAALLLVDAGLIWFGIACLRRTGTIFSPVPYWMLALDAVAVVCVAAAVGLLMLAALSLQFRVGVEVAPET